jgi:hypothetical protein
MRKRFSEKLLRVVFEVKLDELPALTFEKSNVNASEVLTEIIQVGGRSWGFA